MIARAVIASVLALGLAFAVPGGPRCRAKSVSYEQQIFFAVLEGLYADGVSNEVVDKIVAIDDQTKYPANFVWACPVCMPAYNAFRVYRGRPAFQEYKVHRDTFGPGLPPALVERLTAVDQMVSQKALEELISTWMDRRMESLRLNDDERQEWRTVMEELRKKGMGYLDGYRNSLGGSYASMKTCPICEGAN